MNNTITRTLALVAVFMAATLVVGTLATMATSTQSAYAYAKKLPRQDDKKRQEIMEVEMVTTTQLPSRTAKTEGQQVDLIQKQTKNVKT